MCSLDKKVSRDICLTNKTNAVPGIFYKLIREEMSIVRHTIEFFLRFFDEIGQEGILLVNQNDLPGKQLNRCCLMFPKLDVSTNFVFNLTEVKIISFNRFFIRWPKRFQSQTDCIYSGSYCGQIWLYQVLSQAETSLKLL